MTKNAPMNTLLPQPGQTNSYNPTFHPLPGQWAKEQLERPNTYRESRQQSSTTTGSKTLGPQNDLNRALASERAQHEYWEQWQGVTPGRPVYADPRAFQDILEPQAKYGTEGAGYG